MEIPVGGEFEYKGKKLKVVKLDDQNNITCDGCYFFPTPECTNPKENNCTGVNRKDKTYVIFKEIKEEGE